MVERLEGTIIEVLENIVQANEIQDFVTSLGALHRLDDMLSRRLDGSREPYRCRGTLKERLVVSSKPNMSDSTSEKRVFNYNSEDCKIDTMEGVPLTADLFPCGSGRSQAAITPSGELKLCLMIDYPRYRILDTSLKECWQRLRELVSSIKPDENYKCDECELQAYCKWCPARA